MPLDRTFAELTEEDFLSVARQAASRPEVPSEVLVSLATPDILVVEPRCLPRAWKAMTFVVGGRELRVVIGSERD